jgi:hypothetical protein
MRIAMTLLTVALAVSACGGKKKDKDGAGSGSAGSSQAMGSDQGSGSAAGSAAGSGSDTAMAGSGSAGAGDTNMAHKGGNCPSTVVGSTTKAELKDGKVLLTIASDDKDAILAIQKRSTDLLKEKLDGGPSGTAHDQKGTHGGGMGMCPVFLGEGGTATAANNDKGVLITITPKSGPDALKTEIDARITKAADWVKANLKPGEKGTMGGVGGGSGDDGMNHSGQGDGKGQERKSAGSAAPKGDGKGGGKGTGGGGGGGTGGGTGSGSAK